MPITTKVVCFVVCCNIDPFLVNSEDPDQTAQKEQSDLGPHCLHLYLHESNNANKKYAADDLSKQHFQINFLQAL